MQGRILRSLGLAAALAAGALAGAPAAHAGTYTVHSCIDSLTGKALNAAGGWSLEDTHPGESNWNASTTCGADGGSMTVTPAHATDGGSITGSDSSPRYAALRFLAPADTRIKSYELWRSMQVSGYRAFIVSRQHTGTNAEWCNASFSTCRIGDPAAPLAATNRVAQDFGTGSAGYVALQLMCNGSGCGKDPGLASIKLFSAKVVLEELDRPSFASPPGGTLLAPNPITGTRSLDLVATDATSGVRRITITSSAAGAGQVLASKVVDNGNGRCDTDRFVHALPCPSTIDESMNVDTKQFPDGKQTITIQIEDAAGNTRSVEREIEVRNAPTATSEPSVGGFSGQIKAGDTLTCSPGTFEPEPDSLSYAWLVNGAVISSQSNPTYVVRTQDVGRSIVCRVTAVRGGGSTTVDSPPVGGTGQPGGAPAPGTGGTGGTGGSGGTGGTGSSGGTTTTSTTTSTSTTTNTTNVTTGRATNGTNASNSARIAVSGKKKRRVPFGRSVRTSMTLRDEQGRPISGARVAVLQRINRPGAAWTTVRDLVTDVDGRVTWQVPAGPSRTIRFAYKANLANTEHQATKDVLLLVKSKSTLKTNGAFFRNGQSIRFAGRLLGKPIPRGGVLIDLQAKVGNRWQTFLTARSKASGRWAAKYRFRSTRGLQTYTFRARVRQDSAYPYRLSTTRTVSVKVRG